MTLTQYYTAANLDGFIADADSSLDWLVTRTTEARGPLSFRHFVTDLDALARDPEVRQHTYVPSPVKPGFGTTWLAAYKRGRHDRRREGLEIADASRGPLPGLPPSSVSTTRQEGPELGYILATEGRGRGFATEARRLVTDWEFVRGLHGPELRNRADSAASLRVVERCGYGREGFLRSVSFEEGCRTETLVNSRLATDATPQEGGR